MSGQEYGGGIFGGSTSGLGDTGFGDDAALATTTQGVTATPTVSSAYFTKGADTIDVILPSVQPNLDAFLTSMSAALVPPAALPQLGVPAELFRAYVLQPTASVSGQPAYFPLAKVVEAERAAKADYFALPKSIMIPTPQAKTMLLLVALQPGSLQYLATASDLFHYVPPVASAPATPKKAGMGLGTTVLIGAAVLGGAYVATRLYQKKPIFPK